MFAGVCTVVVSIRPDRILLAANRDEMASRAWDPPSAWWPDRPGVIGGRDRTGGGTWMAMNRHGVVATVLNRSGTLGPAAGKRSRGDLPLMAVEHPTADEAAAVIEGLDAGQWRGFNMVLADHHGAWFARGLGYGHPRAERLPQGVSMVTAHDPNDMTSPRTARHLHRFEATEPSVAGWRPILADRHGHPSEQINVSPRDSGFRTVCASFVTLTADRPPEWLFAPGPPDEAEFSLVTTR